MKKLNRNYLSLYNFLGITKPRKNQPKGYSEHGPHYHENSIIPTEGGKFHNPVSLSGYQLLGSLTPFYKTAKDITNFFKPYPNTKKVITNKVVLDLLKPARGVKNILKGIGSLVGGAITFAGWAAVAPFAFLGCLLPATRTFCTPFFSQMLSYPVSWMIEGVGDVLYGSSQIATSALTLPIRLPLRGILTAVANRSGKRFLAEKKPSIQKLAIKAYSKLDHVNPQQFYDADEEAVKDIADVLKEFFNKCKLNENDVNEKSHDTAKTWLLDILEKMLNQIKTDEKYHNKSLYLLLSHIDDTLKKTQFDLMDLAKKYREAEDIENKNETDAKCSLLDQVRNEIMGKMKKVDPLVISKVNDNTDRTRQNVAAILFEVQRKYKKSVNDGWDSAHKANDITTQFGNTFKLFKTKAKQRLREVDNLENKLISQPDINAAQEYLKNFIPDNLVEKAQRKYYVVSAPIQVYNRSWLGSGSTTARNIQKSDVVKSLKKSNELYVFDDFKTAKRFADICAQEDNKAKTSLPPFYPPVVEVALANENQIANKPLNNVARYIGAEEKTNHLEKLLVDKEMKVTSPKNIRYISGYCYKYADYRYFPNRQKEEIKPTSYTSIARNRM